MSREVRARVIINLTFLSQQFDILKFWQTQYICTFWQPWMANTSLRPDRSYFFAPSVLFFNLSWLPLHFLHRSADIGFRPPHLKHTLKNSLRCWAICFLAASVIGNLIFKLKSCSIIFSFLISQIWNRIFRSHFRIGFRGGREKRLIYEHNIIPSFYQKMKYVDKDIVGSPTGCSDFYFVKIHETVCLSTKCQ